jgi:hypothetical protein
MKKKIQLNEVRQLQKIAGILKENIEEKKSSNVLNLYRVSDEERESLYDEHIISAAIDQSEYLASKGVDQEGIDSVTDADEGSFGVFEEVLDTEFPLVFKFEIGGNYVDNELVYDLKDGNVAIEEDYTNQFHIVPKQAFEAYKQALSSLV